MIASIWKWLNDRWPFSTMAHLALDEDIPGGSSFAYTFGSTILTIFGIQAVTGIMQLFFYVPTVDHAYNSMSFLRTKVPFGWLISGLHHWGASAMVVLVVFHMTRVFIWGAYKNPRQLTWIFGLILLTIVMAMSFTGGPLSWDQKAYWEAEVGTSIPGSIPVVGDTVQQIMRGGEQMGQLTLSRLFITHTAILPSVLGLLIGIHLIAFRRFGAVGPWKFTRMNNAVQQVSKGSFWPNQVIKDLLAGTCVIMGLITLAVFAPKPFYGAADPLDSTFIPKPEWNFLFMYQALKFFPGDLEWIGAVGIPQLLILLIVALPFIDRKTERNPKKRPAAMISAAVLAVIIVGLTIIGHFSGPQGGQAASVGQQISKKVSEKTDHEKAQPMQRKSAKQPSAMNLGEKLFHSVGCISCHKVDGTGGTAGPVLTDIGSTGVSRDWLVSQIRTPKKHFPGSIMPSFESLKDAQVNAIVDYLLGMNVEKDKSQMTYRSDKSPASEAKSTTRSQGAEKNQTALMQKQSAASGVSGSKLFHSEGCINCHKIDGKGGSVGPELSRENQKGRTRGWLIDQIRTPKKHFPGSIMPSFESLTEEKIQAIVDYLLGNPSEGGPAKSYSQTVGESVTVTTSSSSGEKVQKQTQNQQEMVRKSFDMVSGVESQSGNQPGKSAFIIGNADSGSLIFSRECSSCHGTEGTDDIPNPGSAAGHVPPLNPIDKSLSSKDPQEFALNIDTFIQHGSVPAGDSPQLHMLSFGDNNSLTQQQIANVEAYILKLNGVDRALLMNNGIEPKRFFFIVTPVFLVLLLILSGIYRCLPDKRKTEGKSPESGQ